MIAELGETNDAVNVLHIPHLILTLNPDTIFVSISKIREVKLNYFSLDQ